MKSLNKRSEVKPTENNKRRKPQESTSYDLDMTSRMRRLSCNGSIQPTKSSVLNPLQKTKKQNGSKDQDKARRTSTSRSRAACRPSNPSVYGCVGRIQTPLIPSVVSMSHGLLSLYTFWYAASSISSYSFHDFLSFYLGCREKEAFDRRHSASLLSVLCPTALKTTPKNPDLTQIGT